MPVKNSGGDEEREEQDQEMEEANCVYGMCLLITSTSTCPSSSFLQGMPRDFKIVPYINSWEGGAGGDGRIHKHEEEGKRKDANKREKRARLPAGNNSGSDSACVRGGKYFFDSWGGWRGEYQLCCVQFAIAIEVKLSHHPGGVFQTREGTGSRMGKHNVSRKSHTYKSLKETKGDI
jgi:hypothetical protein